MNPGDKRAAQTARDRIRQIDWERVGAELAEWGHARIPGLLDPAGCRALAHLYGDDERFRSTVGMEQQRFGAGEYRYFANPLPPLVGALRSGLYARLAPWANRWRRELGQEPDFPRGLGRFLERCHDAGQARPTPLLLRYETGGYNNLHQDRYGSVAFPLQVAILLSRPGTDFGGGEFLLVEQRPRMQSRGFAVALEQGEALVFANAERPVRGARGFYRVQTRHGVSRVTSGLRLTLGVIFHDAR